MTHSVSESRRHQAFMYHGRLVGMDAASFPGRACVFLRLKVPTHGPLILQARPKAAIEPIKKKRSDRGFRGYARIRKLTLVVFIRAYPRNPRFVFPFASLRIFAARRETNF